MWAGLAGQPRFGTMPLMAYQHDTSVVKQEIIQVLFWSAASMATPRQLAHEGRAACPWGERYLLVHADMQTWWTTLGR